MLAEHSFILKKLKAFFLAKEEWTTLEFADEPELIIIIAS